MAKHFNIDKLNQQQACFAEHDLQSYVNHKANKELRFAIENHLLDCEICSDVVEGLQLIYKEKNAANYLESVKQNVKTISSNSSTNNSKFIWWSVAAVFIVAFGSYWFFSQQHTQLKQNDLAQRIEEKAPLPSPSVEEKILDKTNTVTNDGVVANTGVTNKKVENTKKQVLQESVAEDMPTEVYSVAGNQSSLSNLEQESAGRVNNAGQINKSIDANLTYTAPALATGKSEEKKSPRGEIILDDIEESAKGDRTANEGTIDNKKGRKRKMSAESGTKDSEIAAKDFSVVTTDEKTMQEAKKLYDKKQYADAAKLYTQIYYSKSNLEASYYAAASYFKIKYYDTALDFCKINIAAKKDFYEEAQWLQFEILMSTNNTEKAKELLQEISKQNSKFAKQATIELQKLK